MANTTIPNLPLAVGLDGSEQFEIVQAGVSRRTTLADAIPAQSEDAGVFTIESYGGIAGNPAFDNLPAITAAFAAVEQAGKGSVTGQVTGKPYFMSGQVIYDPTKVSVRDIAFDAFLKTVTDPASQPEMVTNGNFDSGSTGWSTGSSQTYAPTYTGGQLVFNPPNLQPEAYFLEQGQRLFGIASGSFIEVTANIQSITTTQDASMINTYRAVNIGFRQGTSPLGTAASVGTTQIFLNTDSDYAEPFTRTWNVVVTGADPWIRIQCQARCVINSISVKVIPPNELFIRRCPSTSANRSHVVCEWRNVIIQRSNGVPDSAGQYNTALTTNQAFFIPHAFDTVASGKNSRGNFYNCDFSLGAGITLDLRNQSYLLKFDGCRMTAMVNCVRTLPGAIDSGENITFVHGNLGGTSSGAAVSNKGGSSLRFVNTSIDFTQSFLEGGGSNEFSTCWLETRDNDTVGKDHVFVLGAGRITMNGGFAYQFDGTSSLICPFNLTTKEARVLIKNAAIYNGRGSADCLAIGEGYIEVNHIMGGSNRECPPIVKRKVNPDPVTVGAIPYITDTDHSLFGEAGEFLTDTVDIDTWITGSTTAEQTSRYNVQYKTTNTFDATLARGSTGLTATTTTGGTVAVGDVISGAGIDTGSTLVAFDNTAHTMTLSQPANGNGATTGSALRWSRPTTASQGTVAISTDYARTGTRSLKLLKAGVGNGTALKQYISCSAEEGRAWGAELYMKVPAIGAANFTIFVNVYFAQVVRDGLIPRVVELLSISSQNVTVPFATGFDWTKFQFTTMRVDSTTQHRGFAPRWATDVIIQFDLGSAPSNTAMYLANLQANNL